MARLKWTGRSGAMHPQRVRTKSSPRAPRKKSKAVARCGAKRRDGGTCRKTPAIPSDQGGNGRCEHHGGLSTGPRTAEGKARVAQNALKHGLYSRALRMLQPEEIREIYDDIPSTTDLSEEIVAARANVVRYGTMLERGVRWIMTKGKGGSTGDKSDSWSEAAVSVDQLYRDAQDILRRLVQAQADMHPGADLRGNLHIRVTVSAEAKAEAERFAADDMDLVGDQAAPEGEGDAPEEHEPYDIPRGPDKLEGF